MAITYENIATQTLSSASAAITFNSIPASFTDLRIVFVGKATYDTDGVRLRFNNDTATNYSWVNLRGNGTDTGTARVADQNSLAFLGQTGGGMSNTIPSFGTADIFSYAGSTHKTSILQDNTDKNGSGDISRIIGTYRSTTAISRIDIFEVSGDLPSGVTATLYGIKNA